MTVAAGIIALENSYVDPKVAIPVVSSSDGEAMIYAANKSKIPGNGGEAAVMINSFSKPQRYCKKSETVVIDSNKSPLQIGTLSNFCE